MSRVLPWPVPPTMRVCSKRVLNGIIGKPVIYSILGNMTCVGLPKAPVTLTDANPRAKRREEHGNSPEVRFDRAANLTGAVGTGNHQAVQHSEKHRPLDGEFELAPGGQRLDDGPATALPPQPLEQERRPDANAGQFRNRAVIEQ